MSTIILTYALQHPLFISLGTDSKVIILSMSVCIRECQEKKGLFSVHNWWYTQPVMMNVIS